MKKEMKAVRKFYSLILPKFYKRGIILFLFLLFAAAIMLPFPFLTQYLVDHVLANPDKVFAIKALIIIGAGLLFLQLFDAFYQYGLGKFQTKFNNDITIYLRLRLTEKLSKIKDTFFGKTDHGTIFHRYVNDIQESQSILFESVTGAVINAAKLIFGFIAVFILSPTMALIVLPILPLYLIAIKKTSKQIISEQDKLIKQRSMLYGFFYEYIRCIRLIKIYVLNIFAKDRLEKRMQEYKKELMSYTKISLITDQVIGLIGALGPLVVLVYGGYQIIIGNFTIGALMALTQFIPYIFDSASGLMDFTVDLERAAPPINNLLSILNYEEEVQKGEDFAPIKKNSIVFENVSFTIDKDKILKDVSFNIKENEMISLVGGSGSGKTSILRVIEGFWYPTEGKAIVGGEDTQKTDIRNIRSAIGYISQESQMLKDTVYENIKLNRKMTLDDVKRYAKMAQVHDFIEKLPNKYDTKIDPDHTNFSGGQLQRISLARALAQDKKILLLDEFSSEIDPATEKKILQEINALKGKRTIVIIAHHKDCVTNSDRIFVMDQGRLIEQGTYRELSSKRSSRFNQIFGKR